uniref:Uncharacterized protein n=1 Tax=Leersia perrieri TaxID=77586 RepID=A0A0D9VB64_9ORYZ
MGKPGEPSPRGNEKEKKKGEVNPLLPAPPSRDPAPPRREDELSGKCISHANLEYLRDAMRTVTRISAIISFIFTIFPIVSKLQAS